MINYDEKWNLDDILVFKEQLDKSLSIISNDNGLMKIYPIYNKICALINNKSINKCNFGNDSIILSSSGKIYPCIVFNNMKEYEIKSTKQMFNNTVPIDKCQNCEYQKYCINNCMCRYKSIPINNSFDINCEFEKIFIDFSKKIIDKMFD